MRGPDAIQEGLFTVAKLDDFVPADHPLRSIRTLLNEALAGLNDLFNTLYADTGRESIAPEKLLRTLHLKGGLAFDRLITVLGFSKFGRISTVC